MSENIRFLERINVSVSEEIKRNIKILHAFRDGNTETNVIIVTNEDIAYCIGFNASGVLGFGHKNPVNVFTINEKLSNKQIIDFKNGFFHTTARTRDGKLYCWGNNKMLGKGSSDDHLVSEPELNEHLIKENIIDYCCGGFHTLVLTSNNEVYSWGLNNMGQTGNGSDDKVVLSPVRVEELKGEKVVAISCGLHHSLALLESGCVYSWGNHSWVNVSSNGQFNINAGNEKKPKRIQTEVKIKKISGSLYHSSLLSSEGDIYVFGGNIEYFSGVMNEEQMTLRKLNHSAKFIDIASNNYFNISAALSENGLYYTWEESGKYGINSEPRVTLLQSSFEGIFLSLLVETDKYFQNGKYISNWKEIKKLGEGSFGSVFEVQYKFNRNKIFAMKKIPHIKADSFINSCIVDSVKESRVFGNILKLKSEFLVKYYDVWIESDLELIKEIKKYNYKTTIYIQMDLCDKTLSDIFKEIKEDPKLFLNNALTELGYYISSELFIEILKGVEYLHNNKIIHRDLHPENILLKRRANGNCIKVGDFGLAKFYDNNTRGLNTGDIGGMNYSAPEVLDCEFYDKRADIYSLGIILQELFGIHDNSDYMDNRNLTSLLKSKYENATILSIVMTSEIYSERLNCEQMLNRREEWAIHESEFNFEEELNILLEIDNENRSYVQNIIVSKLSNFNYYNIPINLD